MLERLFRACCSSLKKVRRRFCVHWWDSFKASEHELHLQFKEVFDPDPHLSCSAVDGEKVELGVYEQATGIMTWHPGKQFKWKGSVPCWLFCSQLRSRSISAWQETIFKETLLVCTWLNILYEAIFPSEDYCKAIITWLKSLWYRFNCNCLFRWEASSGQSNHSYSSADHAKAVLQRNVRSLFHRSNPGSALSSLQCHLSASQVRMS